MKVGLVLGAGGVLGGAWLTGALHALAEETDWDPGSAEFVVGTSAGSMIGVLAASGVPPWFMVAHSAGESFDGVTAADGTPAAEADRAAGAVFRLHRGLPGLGPGSLRMAITALRNPLGHTPLQMMAGWVPAGVISTNALQQIVRRAVPGRWVEHPNYWAVACDYGSGRRTVFGRLDAPNADIAEAVAASCAIPGFYRPVKVGDGRYVDGGVCSASNLDVVAGRGLDLVICLNPLSSGTEPGKPGEPGEPGDPRASGGPLGRGPLGRVPLGRVPLDPRDWLGALSRQANGRRLAHEAAKVRRFGTEVVLIEPTPADHAAMGHNLMSAGRRQQVIETAARTVREQLQRPELRALLADLPPGEPHKIRRPDGPPSSWPELRPAPFRVQTKAA
jgi:NTE family protein